MNHSTFLHTAIKLAEQAARSLNDRPGLSTTLLDLGKIGERRGNYVQAEAYYQDSVGEFDEHVGN